MRTFAHTVEIAREPSEVFGFVTDPDAYPRWQPSLLRIRAHAPGPLRLGSRATEVRTFLGREMETTWTCVEHEPFRRSAIECREGPVPFRGTFELEPSEGGTRFTWSVALLGRVSGLTGPLVARATRGELEASSARLKALLERERMASRR